MPAEGLKALFTVFLDALQEVQPATEAPSQRHASTAAPTAPAVSQEAPPTTVDGALQDGANEINMQLENRGVIRGSMWSQDTSDDGLQHESEA